MAKSIRSKRRRRMRSVKRDKFDKKMLAKLETTLMRDVVNNPDSEMADIVTVKTADDLKSQQSTSTEEGKMDIGGASGSLGKKKTNEHGQYPAWMNQRAVRKQQVKNKKERKDQPGDM